MVVVYHCPQCKLVISDTIYEQSRFDYQCPRCREKKLSEFLIGAPDLPDPIDPADYWKLKAD